MNTGKTIVLTEALMYQHLAEVHNLPPSNLTYEKRAEVALMSGRNIRCVKPLHFSTLYLVLLFFDFCFHRVYDFGFSSLIFISPCS
jgi:hypothetical protein